MDIQTMIDNYQDLQRSLGANGTPQNRLDSYQNPFGYDQMSKIANGQYSSRLNDLNRIYGNLGAQNRKSTGARLASQGITGGSVLNNAINQGQADINRNQTDAMSQLAQQKMAQDMGMMQQENAFQYDRANRAQQIDFQRIQEILQRYGALNNMYGGIQDRKFAVEQYNEQKPTWFDDVLALANTASNFIPKPGK